LSRGRINTKRKVHEENGRKKWGKDCGFLRKAMKKRTPQQRKTRAAQRSKETEGV